MQIQDGAEAGEEGDAATSGSRIRSPRVKTIYSEEKKARLANLVAALEQQYGLREPLPRGARNPLPALFVPLVWSEDQIANWQTTRRTNATSWVGPDSQRRPSQSTASLFDVKRVVQAASDG